MNQVTSNNYSIPAAHYKVSPQVPVIQPSTINVSPAFPAALNVSYTPNSDQFYSATVTPHDFTGSYATNNKTFTVSSNAIAGSYTKNNTTFHGVAGRGWVKGGVSYKF